MTAKEKRACVMSFLLQNEQMSSAPYRFKDIKERPPFFFVGTDELNGRLGDEQAVICLPLWPFLKYVDGMEEAVEELISHIMLVQDEGPFLLGGFCNGGYVAYEIARRLESRGHRVGLLALVETPIIRHGDRLFRLARGLLFSVMRPTELLRYLVRKLGAIISKDAQKNKWPHYFSLLREFERVFGDYCWVRLGSGVPTYPGDLTLLFGDRSVRRCFPKHGWKMLVKGGIEVHVARGDHYGELLDSPEIITLINECILRYLTLNTNQLTEMIDSTV
jgi:thioesterase domain-containing protein